MPSIGCQRGILHPFLAEQTHSGSGSGETSPKTAAPDRTIRSGLPILNHQEGMSVDSSEPIEGQQGSLTNAFSPRVLGMQFSQVNTNQNGYSFEVRIAHFDLLSGRFGESIVQVLLEADQVRKIEPPLIGARDFQQADR